MDKEKGGSSFNSLEIESSLFEANKKLIPQDNQRQPFQLTANVIMYFLQL